MKKLVIASFAVLASLTATAAFAQAPSHYVGVNVGVSDQNGIATNEATKGSIGVTVGAAVNPNFSVEASYQDFGRRDFGLGKMGFSATSVAGVVAVPFNKEFSFIGKMGVAHTAIAQSVGGGAYAALTKTALMAGVGVDFRIDKSMTIRGMVDVYPDFAGSDESLTNISVGVNYAF